MFGFGKREVKLAAPIAGEIMDITAVPDDMFSAKMMGDGFAVEPAPGEDTICAPCDGVVKLVAHTKHAVALEKDGLEILIHVGLDTVELNGEGFTALTKAGTKVKKGEPLLRFDRAVIEAAQKKITTMLVLTNGDEKAKRIDKALSQPDCVLTVRLK